MHSSSLSRAVALGAVLIVLDCAILFRQVLSLDMMSMDFIFCLCLFPVLIYALVQSIRMHQIIQKSNFLTKDVLSCSLLTQISHIIAIKKEQAKQEIHSELADTRAEIGALQSQINPHFLYNTLDSIRGQALIDNSPIIADMTEALSILFRYSISRTGNIVPIQKELYCVEKYMMIQQFRFPGKFEYRKQIDDSLLSCLIPRLTLQPLVENAIYHGLETRMEGGCISISLEQTAEYIVVRISDNGVGMEESQLNDLNNTLQMNSLAAPASHSPKGSGIALSNVNRRIRLNFGEPYGLVISSSPGLGTDVEIILPKAYSREDT